MTSIPNCLDSATQMNLAVLFCLCQVYADAGYWHQITGLKLRSFVGIVDSIFSV